MCRDADMPDDALGLCLEQRLHCAAGCQNGFQAVEARVVELEQLDVVGAQVFQARGDLGLHVGFGQCAAFGRQNEVIPQPGLLQRLADPCLADRVGAGSVDVIDARLMRGDQQLPRAGLVDALNGNAAKPKAGDL